MKLGEIRSVGKVSRSKQGTLHRLQSFINVTVTIPHLTSEEGFVFIYERSYGSLAAADIVLKKANLLEIVEQGFFLRRISLAKSADKSLAPS